MDYKKMETLVYSASWVNSYLEPLVKDLPQHAELLKSYEIVLTGVDELLKENRELIRKLAAVHTALIT